MRQAANALHDLAAPGRIDGVAQTEVIDKIVAEYAEAKGKAPA
jgi:hypothetical protein